jgi:hypothetical protein
MFRQTSMWRGLFVLLATIAWSRPAVVHAPAPQRAASLEAWVGNLAGARREAAERNVVLLVHVILEDEPENDAYRDNLLPHQRILQLSRNAVVIVANNGQHRPETVRETIDGRTVERQRCSVYPMFANCAQHNEPWMDIYRLLQEETGELRCPQTLIELPGGEQAWRFNIADPPPATELIRALEKAQKDAGPGLSAEQLRDVKLAVSHGRAMQNARGWADAWKHWQAVLALADRGMFADEARAGQAACLEALAAETEAAQALLVPGSAAQGYAKLVELLEACAGLPNERELRRIVREAERRADVREEIQRYKIEQEAEEIWREALAQLDEGDERRAQRTIARLLRTAKYAETPAAKRAAERFPEWVP